MAKIDIHHCDRRIALLWKRIDGSEEILKCNKKLIKSFYSELSASGLSLGRIDYYIEMLYTISLLLKKDFRKVKKNDIINLLNKIEEKGYSIYSKANFRITIKKFFKWLDGDKEYPEIVSWIKVNGGKIKNRSSDEMITEDDIKKLINTAENPRDKAFIAVLYESGCRIGEILPLQKKNIIFDKHGAILNVDGKTGPRPVRLISSVPYLATWINNLPSQDQDSFVWISIGTRNRHKLLGYVSIIFVLQRLFAKAVIKKKFNPHLFRHSRASYLANYLTEAQLCQYMGWVPGSRMASVYVHLSGRDVDKAIMKVYGLENEAEKKEESVLKPKKCPRCEKINPATAKLCNNCGLALDIKTAIEMEERNKEIEKARNKVDAFILEAIKRSPEIEKMVLRAIEGKNSY